MYSIEAIFEFFRRVELSVHSKPSAPRDFTGIIADNRHYATGTILGPSDFASDNRHYSTGSELLKWLGASEHQLIIGVQTLLSYY